VPERASALEELSDSQLEILELLGKGKSNEEIGKQLHLGVKNVAAEGLKMQRKLKLKSNNALVRYAVCWMESEMGHV
jgi:DNA-binding CsgD family transcriptional regulator